MKKIVFVISAFIFITLISLLLTNPNNQTNEIRSKAKENSNLYPLEDISSIQQAIDAATDGQTITIPAGTYSGGTAIPLASNSPFAIQSRGASDTCFLRIENKNIIIVGNGVTLYGEGHAKPYQDPYQTRAGVCVLNSNVTFEGLRIKEFQKRGLVAIDSQIIYKNGVMDGSDEGGISLLGNSYALILNNIFARFNFGGVMLWQNSQAKIYNNIFYGANIMFFYHPNSNDSAHADITNNIFTNGSVIIQVDWWTSELPKLKNNNLSYNLIWYGDKSCGANDYCDNFAGKVDADPRLNDAVTDPTGWVYGSFDLQPDSPAVGKGDPSLSGSKNLGPSGGPCANSGSSECSSFINQLKSTLSPPTPIPTAPIIPTEIISTPDPYQPEPTKAPDVPTPIADNGRNNPPPSYPTRPFTYYLPPGTDDTGKTNEENQNQNNTDLTPVPKPTSKPFFDVKKTVENVKANWNNLVTSFLNFTKTILP